MLSKKISSLPFSPIRKLVPFAERAEQQGIKIYKLNIGQPDIPLPQNVFSTIKKELPSLLAYSHSAGDLQFRKAVAEYYGSLGVEIDPERHIITTAGASEALIFTLMAILDPGDEVIIPEPMYANYISFVTMCGGTIIPIPTSIDTGFELPSAEHFAQRITSRTKAILICNPNNPTGAVYTRKQLEDLLALVKGANLWLVVDEVYREFVFGSEHTGSIIQIADETGLPKDKVVVIDSFSKRMSLCGTRTGMVITYNQDLHESLLKMAQARLSPPLLGQLIATWIIKNYPEWIGEVVSEFEKRHRLATQILNEIEGLKPGNPKGAFYTMAELPVDNAEDFCKWLLTDFRKNKKTIMLAPGNGFYHSQGLGLKQVRIAFVLNQTDLKDALLLLADALKQYK